MTKDKRPPVAATNEPGTGTVIALAAPRKSKSVGTPGIAAPLAKLKKLTALADRLVEQQDEMNKAARRNIRHDADLDALAAQFRLDAADLDMITDAKALLNSIDVDEAYNDDGDGDGPRLKSSIVEARLSLLISTFPPKGQAASPEAFTASLFDHVSDIGDLSLLALLSGCRAIEGGRATLPPITAVVETLTAHVAQWKRRCHAIHSVAGTAAMGAEHIAAMREEREREKRRQALYQARNEHDVVRSRLISKQEESRILAQQIAHDFEQLSKAEAALAAAGAEQSAAPGLIYQTPPPRLALPPPATKPEAERKEDDDDRWRGEFYGNLGPFAGGRDA
jgi:hypothetical protein